MIRKFLFRTYALRKSTLGPFSSKANVLLTWVGVRKSLGWNILDRFSLKFISVSLKKSYSFSEVFKVTVAYSEIIQHLKKANKISWIYTVLLLLYSLPIKIYEFIYMRETQVEKK